VTTIQALYIYIYLFIYKVCRPPRDGPIVRFIFFPVHLPFYNDNSDILTSVGYRVVAGHADEYGFRFRTVTIHNHIYATYA